MRGRQVLIAGALWWGIAPAAAASFSGQPLAAEGLPLIAIHHKPGHEGGPPWKRHKQGRYEEREYRQYDQRYSTRYNAPRSVCRTTERTYFDDYTGEHVRRSVRVCD
jgi:hypothetical protein